MKRLSLCLLALAFLLCACGRNAPPPEEGGGSEPLPSQGGGAPVFSDCELPVVFIADDQIYRVTVQTDGDGFLLRVDRESDALFLVATCEPDGSYASHSLFDEALEPEGRPTPVLPALTATSVEREFDENGVLRKETETLDTFTTVREYRDGNLMRVLYSDGDSIYGTEYAYDKDGRQITEWNRNADGQIESEISREYDQNGNEIRRTWRSANGNIYEETYEYDGDGRLVREAGQEWRREYFYDGQGRLILTVFDCYNLLNDTGTAIFPHFVSRSQVTYNEQGDVLTELLRYTTEDGGETTEVRYDYRYEYDESGRKIKEVYSIDGEFSSETTYSYPGGRVETVIRNADGSSSRTLKDGDDRWKDVYRDPDGTEHILYDVQETAALSMTETQYAYFLDLLLHITYYF